jgi:Tol biopolymer transport system component
VADPFSYGIVSPDGKMVACSAGQGLIFNQNSLLVRPAAGGEARKMIDRVYPVVWSADSEWLVCKPYFSDGWEDEIRFVRVADGRQVTVASPGFLIRQSPHGRKLLFYHGSYGQRGVLKVVSAAGGPPAEFEWPSMSSVYGARYQLWTPDSRSILLEGQPKGGHWGLWALRLDGKDPQSLTIDHPVRWKADSECRGFSPDGSKLLLSVEGEDETFDLWMVPISLARMESTGPAVKVFGGMVPRDRPWRSYLNAWSPDSSRIAFIHKGDVWVASADGKSSLQLTKTSEQAVLKEVGGWSPDGTMIAFVSYPLWKTAVLHVVPASGGEARVIADVIVGGQGVWLPFCAWSPDGKELTIVSESGGIISSLPISGGNARTVVRPKDMGIRAVGGLRWSPDGRALAFRGKEEGTSRANLYVYRPDSAKLERLDDNGYEGSYWSPDSKWISYLSGRDVKVRPEGVLWEMDVEEALAKLAK